MSFAHREFSERVLGDGQLGVGNDGAWSPRARRDSSQLPRRRRPALFERTGVWRRPRGSAASTRPAPASGRARGQSGGGAGVVACSQQVASSRHVLLEEGGVEFLGLDLQDVGAITMDAGWAAVRRGDPAGLARAAGRLLDDPDRRASLSDAAFEAVRAYDWPVVARDVVAVYETVVSGAGHVRVAAVAARGR